MTVHLVGAGCGAPGFLTLRGRELLEGADHVVYDRLLHPDLLQLCPSSAALHPVGKREADHRMKQPEINELLVRLGREGGTVVRLKGGDPFVFGRGGEEALALQEAGVGWEVVPGLTAGLAGTGTAGFPLTHRGLSRSLTLVTGHAGKGAMERRFWRPLARTPGTLGIYMGTSNLKEIVGGLLEEGLPPYTPVAAVTWGGWGRCRVYRGTVEELPQAARDGRIPSPSIILAGEVASLELRPQCGELAGMQVAVCRPYPNSWTTARLLESKGADGYSVPLLRSAPLEVPGIEGELESSHWVVLTSPRGVSRLLDLVGDVRRIVGKLVVIGPGTAAALAGRGLQADLVPDEPTSKGLAAALQASVRPGEKVLFVRNERSSPLPVRAVEQAGARPVVRATYRMERAGLPAEELYREMWGEVPLDVAVFGSGALVEAWHDRFGLLPEGVVPVAWGAFCGETVKEVFGLEPLVMREPSNEGLLEALGRLRKGVFHG